MAKNDQMSAKVIQILDEFEFPELLLLEGPSDKYTLAVRSGDLDKPENFYVGGSMTLTRLREYSEGKFDLKYALENANGRAFWSFEYLGGPDVLLSRITRTSATFLCSLPLPGAFASRHRYIEVAKTSAPSTIVKFQVDGGWELSEFSHFYSQIEDIYHLSNDAWRYSTGKACVDERGIIERAFQRSWGGGGSYGAFYRSIANNNYFHDPLKVRGIEYNSPGHVSIYAHQEPFDRVLAVLKYYSENKDAVRKSLAKISRFMTVHKMNSIDYSLGLMSIDQRDSLHRLSSDLMVHIPTLVFDDFFKMVGSDVLVAAKVGKSLVRRVERLYEFFSKGRVSVEGLEIRCLVKDE